MNSEHLLWLNGLYNIPVDCNGYLLAAFGHYICDKSLAAVQVLLLNMKQ